jgi:broad specificity phosphatase PhoE
MSRLILVRHAQASFFPDPSRAFVDYDRLSPLGRRQAQALGEELATAGLILDRVYMGPAARQRETAEKVAAVYARHGLAWPEVELHDGLAEHEGAAVVRNALARAADHEEDRERLAAALAAAVDGPLGPSELQRARREASRVASGGDATRAYFTAFQRITRRWARGELPDGLAEESWASFRARVGACVREIVAAAGRGSTVAAFTSGGPIGSTVASVLGLGDEKALELAWAVQNATLTELLFDGERVSLRSFNAQPRIGSPELVTHV